MTDYRYIFGSLRNEQVVAEIDLQGTFMDLELNVGGRFDGTFSLDQTGKRNQDMLDATIPGRSFVAVERYGVPIWLGFVWSRTYQSQSKTVQLFAQSFENFPEYQLVRSASNVTGEQRVLFRDLWEEMQAVEGRNMNILLPDEADLPEVVVKSVLVEPTDYKYYSELMSALSDSSNGFDWYIGVSKTGSQYNKTLRIGYPVIGATDASRLVFEYPGNILNYYATESMTSAGTNVFTLGKGEGSEMIAYESTQDLMISQGFPRWDQTVSRKDIDNAADVAAVGAQEGVIRKPPMLVIKPQMKGDKVTPQFGDFALGDACSIIIKDPRFPAGLNFKTRIVKWSLNPASASNVEEYTVLFAGDEEG